MKMEENKIIIECKCGCEGIKVERIDNEIFISFWIDSFYVKQNGLLSELIERLKIAWNILRKGVYLYEEIILTKNDAIKLQKCLENMIVGMDNDNNNLKERLRLIADIAYDYDGCNTVQSLKELIDEIRDIALGIFPKKEVLDALSNLHINKSK